MVETKPSLKVWQIWVKCVRTMPFGAVYLGKRLFCQRLVIEASFFYFGCFLIGKLQGEGSSQVEKLQIETGGTGSRYQL
ncbi:hypothetical protein ASL14_26400 (plasmid) [Paenibacillus sp. IHB B 3084]|nr:hypothetical protein ASL14_26400 [Paenibacillus sp. IHB B 3084]